MKNLRTVCARGHEFEGQPPCPLCWPGYRTYSFEAEVWLYSGKAAWHFISVPKAQSDMMKERFGTSGDRGMLPITASVGAVQWNTSVFFDRKTSSYLLPLKAEVRKKEPSIEVGKTVAVTMTVRGDR